MIKKYPNCEYQVDSPGPEVDKLGQKNEGAKAKDMAEKGVLGEQLEADPEVFGEMKLGRTTVTPFSSILAWFAAKTQGFADEHRNTWNSRTHESIA